MKLGEGTRHESYKIIGNELKKLKGGILKNKKDEM